MTNLLAIQTRTPLGPLTGGDEHIYHIPAFFFDWLITRYNARAMINVGVDMGMLLILRRSVSQLRTTIPTGRILFGLSASTVATATTVVDIGLLDRYIRAALEDSEEGRLFLLVWNSATLTLNAMTGFEGVRNVRTYINIFQNLLHAYYIYSNYLEEHLTPDRYEELRSLMREIRITMNNDDNGR